MLLTKGKLKKMERDSRDLIDTLLARAMANDHYPNFPKAEACRQSTIFLHEAANNLFMAVQALEKVDE
jgi:hypothetical protein